MEKKNAKASNNTHQILYRKDTNQILLKIETKKAIVNILSIKFIIHPKDFNQIHD